MDVATTFFRCGVREITKVLKNGALEKSFLFSLLRPFLSVEWGEKLADATSRGEMRRAPLVLPLALACPFFPLLSRRT